ncbi:MAG: hypothetical protein GFH27_549361n61 [Chloroflexi bacterium AL-W]|nr:hypothetical protein [Chloroflexi bacterium AL-N1]NOK70773.1 hypothetical protein [Chloroflexi bacterium AL-N10]NOK78333.1 hypothetical protein [Chloroflexi bacterium AL-N5]NOK85676.1 hypothetical protein [Chloroflexi bacterium AL-W]NOK92590.1 hypothetical protein [Chloroflexi bacterium AL-N15]
MPLFAYKSEGTTMLDHYHIDVSTNVIMVKAVGLLTLDSIKDLFVEPMRDPAFISGLNICCDLRDVKVDISAQAMWQLVEVHRQCAFRWGKAKCALVASSNVVFGLGRMYSMCAEPVDEIPLEVRVFRDMTSANEWLSLT